MEDRLVYLSSPPHPGGHMVEAGTQNSERGAEGAQSFQSSSVSLGMSEGLLGLMLWGLEGDLPLSMPWFPPPPPPQAHSH